MAVIDGMLGHPIYITTKVIQRRKHHKKRINKKWQKRYGYYELNMMPDNQVIMMDGVIFMTKKTFEFLKKEQRWQMEKHSTF